MALIDDVKAICDRLANDGWRDLLQARTEGFLDIGQTTAEKLKSNLLQEIPGINRTGGFEDLHRDCRRGIEPGSPARSMLYHALASPRVLRDQNGRIMRSFPTEADIDTVENLIFALTERSLQDIVEEADVRKLSIVVFATEYRTAPDTVSKAHADLVFSRTGIARVGTAPPQYDEKVRGYWPEVAADPHAFRVVPARFSAWLAAPIRGDDAAVMRLRPPDSDENRRRFWQPLHKLFEGNECLKDHNLALEGSSKFFNMKLQRVRMSLGEIDPPNSSPFVITEGLADLQADNRHGRYVVVPRPKERLVEPAMLDDKPLTFDVPAGGTSSFATHMTAFTNLPTGEEIHRFPAYVHARTRVEDDRFIDLNEEEDVNAAVNAGGYEALHYLDFTAEGWVTVDVPVLTAEKSVVDKPRAAYAILAAPDFFPSAGQREVSEWSNSDDVPASLRGDQLWGVTPVPLSETRLPANLQIPANPFDANEQSITAVTAMSEQPPVPKNSRLPDIKRSSMLPDDAAGIFAPGWTASVDVKGDMGNGTPHLATYGLGSPFPEDAKLCAALSTFWPAVSPDVYRTLSVHTGNPRLRGTVAPLTDSEIGQEGSLPWDGIAGPRIIEVGGSKFVEMASFLHADYVRTALDNQFSIRNTARIGAEDYQRRVLVAGRVHWVLSGGRNARAARPFFLFTSFTEVANGEPDLEQAQLEGGHVMDGDVYRVETCFVSSPNVTDPTVPSPRGVAFRLLPLRGETSFFVSASDSTALRKRDTDTRWRPVPAE